MRVQAVRRVDRLRLRFLVTYVNVPTSVICYFDRKDSSSKRVPVASTEENNYCARTRRRCAVKTTIGERALTIASGNLDGVLLYDPA